jgi:DNA-binding NtrC family response regulator
MHMNQTAQDTNAGLGLDQDSSMSDFVRTHTLGLIRPQSHGTPPNTRDAVQSLEKAKDSLIFAYLAANLNFKSIPFKEFTDDLEKNILLACLRLTHGCQRDAASMLNLKPTALFEKMRKHGINGKRIKLSKRLETTPSREIA